MNDDEINIHDFHYNVYSGNIKEVQRMIDDGVNINGRDDSGYTALIHAVNGNDIGMVNLLLDYGADPYLQDNYGGISIKICIIRGI